MSFFNFKKRILPLAIVLLVLIIVWQVQQKPSAPNVQFQSLQQQTVALKDLRGKMVMVNFWATTCPGCVAEIPKLVETWQQYHQQGFEVIAIAMQYDDLKQIQNFVQQKQLPFIVTYDADGSLSQAFGNITVTPTAFVLDAQGHIINKTIGDFNFAKLHESLKQQLKSATL